MGETSSVWTAYALIANMIKWSLIIVIGGFAFSIVTRILSWIISALSIFSPRLALSLIAIIIGVVAYFALAFGTVHSIGLLRIGGILGMIYAAYGLICAWVRWRG